MKRNHRRFPPDFTFQLTTDEKIEVVTNCDHLARLKFSRTLPYAFTEHGVAMLSSVLNSERAIEVNILIMRTFGRLREMIASHKDLARKFAALEEKYDAQFRVVLDFAVIKTDSGNFTASLPIIRKVSFPALFSSFPRKRDTRRRFCE